MLLVVLALICAMAMAQKAPDPFAGSTQIIVATTADWPAVGGVLQRYERRDTRGSWKPAGLPIPIVVGKTGLAWGRGTADVSRFSAPSDPQKKEGDGKAPAGIFRLSRAFGYASSTQPGWKMPYIALTPTVECVDDTSSKFYNQVLDRNTVTPDWNSSEHMRREDDLYRWGVIVDHNTPPAPGAGSCIFLHIAHPDGSGTVGCTAMPQSDIEELLGWLDPTREPLLVQMPKAQYDAVKKRWHLPE